MNPRRKKRLFYVSLIIVGLSSMSGLVLYALNTQIDLFFTPNEIYMGKDETGIKPQPGQRIRIGGMVAKGSVKRDPESLKVAFDLFDDSDHKITVRFQGILPDLFREGQGIVALGVYQADGTVLAEEVLAKHDENYMPPEIAEKMKAYQAKS